MQKARVTSSDAHLPAHKWATVIHASVEMISSSRGLKNPDCTGKPVTSVWLLGGSISAGIVHSGGIAALRASCLASAMPAQVSLPIEPMLLGFQGSVDLRTVAADVEQLSYSFSSGWC